LVVGDAVALDPSGASLYVKQTSKDPIRIVRVPVGGGEAREIPISGDMQLTAFGLSPAAVDSRGRILVDVGSRRSFYNGPALIDPARKTTVQIPMKFDGDVGSPGWRPNGHVVAVASQFSSSLWRYRQTTGGR
jgi:hypothetical protein